MPEKTQNKSREVWNEDLEVVSDLSYVVHFHNCTIEKVVINQSGIPAEDPGGEAPPPALPGDGG